MKKTLLVMLALVVLGSITPLSSSIAQAQADMDQLAIAKSHASTCRTIKAMHFEEWQQRCMWDHAAQKLGSFETAQRKCSLQIDSCAHVVNLQ